KCKHFVDYLVQINPIASRRSLFDERANARDNFASTIAVFNNTLDRLTPFRQVGRRACKPTQARIAVRNNRGQRLVYFVSDRRGQLADSHDARDVRQLCLSFAQSLVCLSELVCSFLDLHLEVVARLLEFFFGLSPFRAHPTGEYGQNSEDNHETNRLRSEAQ